MSTLCGLCKEIVFAEDIVICSGSCEQAFHYHCAGYSEKTLRAIKSKSRKHICLECRPETKSKSKPKQADLDDVALPDQESSNVNKSEPIPTENVSTQFLDKIDDPNNFAELKSFIKQQFADFTVNLEYHNSVVSDLTSKLEGLTTDIKELKEKQSEIEAENKQLKSDLSQVKCELMELQQYTRRTNVEISGLPELENEDIGHTIRKVFDHIGLENHQSITITAMHRVPTNRKDNHKPIIIQFANKSDRDMCLQKAKQTRFLSSDIDSRYSTSPVFINEHLAPAMKRLFFLSKTFKNEKGFKYCWIKEGKIFLRQGERARAYRIQKESDLINIPVAEA